jgi:hypothetical protein
MYKLKKMKALTTRGESQQHIVMPEKTGIQEGMDPCSPDPGLRQDDQNTQNTRL